MSSATVADTATLDTATLDTATLDAATFAALGEPSRLRIVELLRDGPRSVGEIVEHLDIRQPQASKHLRVLDQAGLVSVEPRHRHRIYRLRSERFHAVADWVDSFERLWDTRLDSLGALLRTLGPEAPDPETSNIERKDQ